MRVFKFAAILFLITAGCTPVTRIQVTRLGFEPAEVREKIIYTLPQTMLKVEIRFENTVFIPGPYASYAQKYLGIGDIKTSRTESWHITSAMITSLIEVDPDHYYVINTISGSVPFDIYNKLRDQGLVSNGFISGDDPGSLLRLPGSQNNFPIYTDVTVDPYIKQKKETMYKTIVTDTSFIEVPVSRTVLQKKTLEQKAEEAANFILEIRLSRFELLSGYGEVFPDGEAMESTLKRLDRLEQEYLSLFIGKQATFSGVRVFYILPDQDEEQKYYPVAYFSENLGFVPALMNEGKPVFVTVKPEGKTKSIRNLVPQSPEEGSFNEIYYRLPDVAEIRIEWNNEELFVRRMNIFQLGALVSVPVTEEKKTPFR